VAIPNSASRTHAYRSGRKKRLPILVINGRDYGFFMERRFLTPNPLASPVRTCGFFCFGRLACTLLDRLISFFVRIDLKCRGFAY
jgi:hypothetical protein